MDERARELKGNLKEGAGRVVGDESMEQEGRAEAEQARMERHVEGAVDQTVGAGKELAGDIAGNPSLEAEGEAQQRSGEAKRQ